MVGDTNTVLVADDDPTVVAQARSWLDDRYRVETATTGDELLSLVGDADAVLVDRDLRTASGTVVAAEIERRATAQTMAILSNDERRAAVHTTAGGSSKSPSSEPRFSRPSTDCFVMLDMTISWTSV